MQKDTFGSHGVTGCIDTIFNAYIQVKLLAQPMTDLPLPATMVFARLCTLVLAVSCTVSASASNSLGTPSSPPAFRPRVISSSIELAGSLTRTTTTYVLKPVSNSVGSSAAGTREWIVGVQGDGRAFVEASVGKAGAKRAVEVRQLDDKSIK